MVTESRMVFLGFGKFARSDKIYALEPLRGAERGDGQRTKVWVEGLSDPIIASRTERTILQDMGQGAAADAPILTEALDLAQRLAVAAEAGRVDLGDLGRRARHLLASTTTPDDSD
jgi:hypothetical protein